MGLALSCGVFHYDDVCEFVVRASWVYRHISCTHLGALPSEMASQEEVQLLKYVLLSMITMSAGSVATLDVWFSNVDDACLLRPVLWGGLTLQHQLWVSAGTMVMGWYIVAERLSGFRRVRDGGQTLRVFFLLWTLLGLGMWIAVTWWSTPCIEMVSSYLVISMLMKLTVVCIV